VTLAALEELLHETIPLAGAMAVRVRAFDDQGLRLEAPLRENGNPHGTIFGGSAAALTILAGWSLVHLRLRDLGLDPPLVIQRSTVDFVAPAPGDVAALAEPPGDQAWARFLRTFRRRGRARIAVSVRLRMGDQEVARATAWYVALQDETVA
jgi:thioesterase domain-containing protein